VAREGGLLPAGKVLRVPHPTLSAQIHALEDNLGEKLFSKVGRRLVLTERGRVVFRYADEIFTLGREMVDSIKGRGDSHALRLDVGIADVGDRHFKRPFSSMAPYSSPRILSLSMGLM